MGLIVSGKWDAGSKEKFRVLAKRGADQLARIFIANGNPGEISQLVRPIAVQPVRCIVIAKARGIGNKFFGPQSRTIKDGIASIPGMPKVPHFVAANDNEVIAVQPVRIVQSEAIREIGRAQSELKSLMRISSAVFSLNKKTTT